MHGSSGTGSASTQETPRKARPGRRLRSPKRAGRSSPPDTRDNLFPFGLSNGSQWPLPSGHRVANPRLPIPMRSTLAGPALIAGIATLLATGTAGAQQPGATPAATVTLSHDQAPVARAARRQGV